MNFSIQSGTVSNFKASRGTGWFRVNFPSSFSSTPVVFAQIQSYGGMDTPGIRIQNVSASGFDVRMDELVAHGATSSIQGNLGKFMADGTHPNPETLGWIAVG